MEYELKYLKEMKELEGRTFTLLDLTNKIESITGDFVEGNYKTYLDNESITIMEEQDEVNYDMHYNIEFKVFEVPAELDLENLEEIEEKELEKVIVEVTSVYDI